MTPLGCPEQFLPVPQLYSARFGNQSATERRWSFVGAFAAFLLVCTCQQGHHRGSGRGSRKVGATNRFLIRFGFVGVLMVLPPIFLAIFGDIGARRLHGPAHAAPHGCCRAHRP